MLARRREQAVFYARTKTKNFQRADASFFSIRRVHHEEIGRERLHLLGSRSTFSRSTKP